MNHSQHSTIKLYKLWSYKVEIFEFQGFFELLSQQEIDYLRCLTFLLLYSHILIYTEPGCRFDQSFCRNLKRANELRRFCQREISLKLSGTTGFPHTWSAEGRLAQPRCLFAFHRHLLRGDLNFSRKVCFLFIFQYLFWEEFFMFTKIHFVEEF